MLVHTNFDYVLKLINSLNETQHTFILHVDNKLTQETNELQSKLLNYSKHSSNIHILDNNLRENISWGGFSIVNATINAMKLAWSMNISFDYMIDISGSTYPLKTKLQIKQTFAKKVNAIYAEIPDVPHHPSPEVTHSNFCFVYLFN